MFLSFDFIIHTIFIRNIFLYFSHLNNNYMYIFKRRYLNAEKELGIYE